MLCTIGIVAAGRSSFPTAGVLLSTYCVSADGYDASGMHYSGNWASWGIYADGSGGSYDLFITTNVNGCYYPYGYWFDYNYYQLSLFWQNGPYSGTFSYGYGFDGSYSDGYGGSVSGYYQNITVVEGQVINEYTDLSQFSGLLTKYTAYFGGGMVNYTEYVIAGTLIGSGCSELYNYMDAAGNSWAVNVKYNLYADGSGGEYYTYIINDSICGYLPTGFYTAYTYDQMYISYSTYEGYPQTFNYGYSTSSSVADGYGGSTVGASINNYHPAGYIFYSYHDVDGAQTVNFTFDGGYGYYVAYVMD